MVPPPTPQSAAPAVLAVLMTFASSEEAARIGAILVQERLAACVNLLSGVRSLFFWENALQDATEVLAVAKTTSARLDALVKRVKGLHSYSVPEIVGVPIVAGSEEYLHWVRTSVSEPE